MYSFPAVPIKGEGEQPMTSRDPEGDRQAPVVSARAKKTVTLRFGGFGWESLESQAVQHGETLDESLSRAMAYFDAMLPTTRAAAIAPRFKPRDEGAPREIPLELTHESWERLEHEAERQGVPLEQLLEHAALLHLSDAESGRVADHIVDRAAEDESSGAGEGRPEEGRF
jgi:hypothetical protein